MFTNMFMRRSLAYNSVRYFGYKPRQVQFKNWDVVTGDYVHVLSGKNKGKEGKVLRVLRAKNQVLVQGVNYKYKKIDDDEYVRRKKTVQKEHPLHISNVSLIDPETNKPTRVRHGFLEDGSKVRVAIKSGALIPKPEREDLKLANRTREREVGPLDTKPDDVLEKTYKGEDFVKIKKEFEEFLRIKREKERNLVFDE